MFIRQKVVRGVTYFALVENYRKDGKVRQRTVASLNQCSTVADAIAEAKYEIELFSNIAENLKHLKPDERTMHEDFHFYSRNSALRRVAKAEARLVVLQSVGKCDKW